MPRVKYKYRSSKEHPNNSRLFQEIIWLCKDLLAQLRIFLRKLGMFIAKNNWYINRNNNWYNPVLGATVYQCGFTWNIARQNIHYEHFPSREDAMNTAFEMWLEERTLRNFK